MQIQYRGPSVAVEVKLPDGTWVIVARDAVIDVPEEFGLAKARQAEWSAVEGGHVTLQAAFPGLSEAAAKALVEAGYGDEAALSGAHDDDLQNINGVGPVAIAAIRAVIPATEGDDE